MNSIGFLTSLVVVGGIVSTIERPDLVQSMILRAHAEASRLTAESSGNHIVDDGVNELKLQADQIGRDYKEWDARRMCWVEVSHASRFERDTGDSIPLVKACAPMKQAGVPPKRQLAPAPAAPRGYDDGGIGGDCECRPLQPPAIKQSYYQSPYEDDYGDDYPYDIRFKY